MLAVPQGSQRNVSQRAIKRPNKRLRLRASQITFYRLDEDVVEFFPQRTRVNLRVLQSFAEGKDLLIQISSFYFGLAVGLRLSSSENNAITIFADDRVERHCACSPLLQLALQRAVNFDLFGGGFADFGN